MMLSVSSRIVAIQSSNRRWLIHRSLWNATSLWTGISSSSSPTSSYSRSRTLMRSTTSSYSRSLTLCLLQSTNSPTPCPRIPPFIGRNHGVPLTHHATATTVTRRNYIFLPSTIHDALKLLQSQFDYQASTHRGRITVKLSTRWHDRLAKLLQRYHQLLRLTKTTTRWQPAADITTPTHMLHNERYKSSLRWQWGITTRRLLTHYNAKKRVFSARRKRSVRRLEMRLFRNVSPHAPPPHQQNSQHHYHHEYYTQKRLQVWKNRWRNRVEKKRLELREWLFRNARGHRVLDPWTMPRSVVGNVTTTTTYNNNSNNNNDNNSNSDNNNQEESTWKSLVLTEPTQTSWFDTEGYPLTSREEETGRFVNPWLSQSTNGENGWRKFLRWKLGGVRQRWWWGSTNVEAVEVKKRRHEEGVGSKRGDRGTTWPYREGTMPYTLANAFTEASTQDRIQLTWLGHSTTLVSLPGNFTILTDPHFSNYAGPMRRNDPPPVRVMDLPQLDCVLISHDHMDHCSILYVDYWSILELIDSDKVKFWVVPLGIKEWLIDKAGVCPEDIVELEWWEGVRISKPRCESNGHGSSHSQDVDPVVEELVRPFDTSNGQERNNQHPKLQPDRNEMVITCAPAQHWCSRTPFDRNRRLWCSWAVHTTPSVSQDSITTRNTPQTHSFYFAGDTGLPPEFPLHHQIGDRLGPFDLAAIPIGAYEPRWFMRESHCDPAEAVAIHQAIRSSRSVTIHFDTFNLADEPQAEPPQLLMEEVERVNEEIGRLAAQVVAVADEVGAVIGMVSAVEAGTVDGEVMGNMDGSMGTEATLVGLPEPLETTEKLMEVLPPLVDFAVIPQGHFIESSPKC
eukprot:CCRYP_019956-RA/>CCRYP_019956-RA protein AED:0.00 eAED:-0.00 QI:105/0/0.66/0.66/1/1/3/182/846